MGLQRTLRFEARDIWDCSRRCGLVQGTYGIAADVAVWCKGHMGLQQTLRFAARDMWNARA